MSARRQQTLEALHVMRGISRQEAVLAVQHAAAQLTQARAELEALRARLWHAQDPTDALGRPQRAGELQRAQAHQARLDSERRQVAAAVHAAITRVRERQALLTEAEAALSHAHADERVVEQRLTQHVQQQRRDDARRTDDEEGGG